MVQMTPQVIAISFAVAMATLGGVFFAAACSNGFVLSIDNVASTFISKRRKRGATAPHVPMERALLRGMDILDKGLDRVRDRDMVALQRQCLALGRASPWVLCRQAFQFVQKFSEMEIDFVFKSDEKRAKGEEFISFSQQKRRNICMMEWNILSKATCVCEDEQRQRQFALLDLAVRLEEMDLLESQFNVAMVQLDIETFTPDECVLCISVSARLGYWRDLTAIWSRLDKMDPQCRWQIYHLWRERGVADYSVLYKILCEPQTCVPPFSPDSSLPSSHREAMSMKETRRHAPSTEAMGFSQWAVAHVNKQPALPQEAPASPVRSEKRLTSTSTSRTLDFSSSSSDMSSRAQGSALLLTPLSSRSIAAMSPSRYHGLHSPLRPEGAEPSSSSVVADKDCCIRIEGHLCFLYGIGELPMLTGFFYRDRIYAKGWRQGGASSSSGESSMHETVSLCRQSTLNEGGVRISNWTGVHVHSHKGSSRLEIRFEAPLDAKEASDIVSFSPPRYCIS